MDKINIVTWKNISKKKWDALLLGNGASIAINKKFAYETLYRVAEEKRFLGASAPIFGKLETKDFEHVLLACWYANHVNEALGTPSNNISDAYKEVRTALIQGRSIKKCLQTKAYRSVL